MLGFLFDGSLVESFTVSGTILIIISALLLGMAISVVYMQVHKKQGYSADFILAMIMLPAIISMIILLVGNSVARAFSLAGAFSLIRFRSAAGSSKDIAYVFFTLGVGLACGMGYIGYGVVFAVVLCLAMIVLESVKFGQPKTSPMRLKIVLPEDMDYNGVFDDVLKRYTKTHTLTRVKTAEYGSLYELTYEILLRDMKTSKEFIDTLRCKNGNLNLV